jgi:hypothetical protein
VNRRAASDKNEITGLCVFRDKPLRNRGFVVESDCGGAAVTDIAADTERNFVSHFIGAEMFFRFLVRVHFLYSQRSCRFLVEAAEVLLWLASKVCVCAALLSSRIHKECLPLKFCSTQTLSSETLGRFKAYNLTVYENMLNNRRWIRVHGFLPYRRSKLCRHYYNHNHRKRGWCYTFYQ